MVGLILGVVAIFQKRASKGLAISGTVVSFVAMVLSFILAIVYTAGFVAAVDESVPKPAATQVGEPSDSSATNAPANINAKFGETVTYVDGLEVAVSAPTPFTPGEFAAGADQANNVVFTVTVTNGTKEDFEPFLIATASAAGVEGSQVFDPDNDLSFSPTTTIPAGQSISYQVGFSVADSNQIVFELRPGFMYVSTIYQY